jgi:hypothetical protein
MGKDLTVITNREDFLMNKHILLFAALICIHSASQIRASVEGTYRDIKILVEDNLLYEDDVQRLCNIENAIEQLKIHKQQLQNDIIQLHAYKGINDITKTLFGSIGGALLLGSVGTYVYHLGSVSIDISQTRYESFLPFSIACAILLLSQTKIDIYFKQGKIREINAVIGKLELWALELSARLVQNEVIVIG